MATLSRILIAGLPGCGKDRWIAARSPEMQVRLVPWQWGDVLPAGMPVWVLVDLRGEPSRLLPVLEPLLAHADAVIGVFAEAVALTRQAVWRRAIPALHFSHHLQAPFLETLPQDGGPAQTIPLPVPALTEFRAALPVVMLEHLLFALQGLEQGPGMRFWRVQGTVRTAEYAHPVAVEGSLAGLFTHPAEQAEETLRLWVENADPDLLREALQAAVLPGQPPVRLEIVS